MQTYPADELLVLIVGPSADRISPDESAVVSRLNELRSEYGMRQLRMGTMHFDRPREAQFLRDVLGIQQSDVVCLSLVLLDSRTDQMKRNLYSVPRVTPEAIDASEGELLRQWSELSGVALPTALRPVGPSTRPPDRPVNDPTSPGTYLPPTDPQSRPRPPQGEVLSPEGIVAVARNAEQATDGMWNQIRNTPVREDGEDREVRRTLLGLTERTRLLRIALEEGVANPKSRFESVIQGIGAFERSEPRFYLPVAERKQLPKLMKALQRVEQAYYQLNP